MPLTKQTIMNDFGNSSPNYTHQQETGLGEFGLGCLLFGMVLEKKPPSIGNTWRLPPLSSR